MLLRVVPSLEVKAWQTQVGDTKNVVMRLKSTVDDTEQEKDGSGDFVICMTAEKFRVLHHGNLDTISSMGNWNV